MVHIPPASVPKLSFAAPSEPPQPAPATATDAAAARFSLAGKRVIVTGGCGGLGYEAAVALAQHGASSITLVDMAAAQGDAAARLQAAFPGTRVAFAAADVTDEAAVAAVVAGAGAVDVLLTFAGIVGCAAAADAGGDAAHWRRILDVNTTGAYVCARAVGAAAMAAGRPASIVLVASISGHAVNTPQPQAAYNVSKAGVLHLARCLAAEWARYGIRVNSVSPGYMDTVLNEGPALDEHRRVWCERTPMGRLGGRGELNGAVVLLCSDAASFITGTDIKVDGGITTTM